MRKLLSLIIILGLLACAGTAFGEEFKFKCSLIKSHVTTEGSEHDSGHYINPRYISSLITQDYHRGYGSFGKFALFVQMTNGEIILYGRYRSNDLRRNSIQYIHSTILVCNK